MPTKRKVKYYSIWENNPHIRVGWAFRKSLLIALGPISRFIIEPDLFIVNGEIGVWLNKKKLENNPTFRDRHEKYCWEIREFTPLDALKERTRNCRSA